MINNMLASFSCRVLDAEASLSPGLWCMNTVPEYKGKGYAKVLFIAMAKSPHGEGYPV